MTLRLKTTQVATVRNELLVKQGMRCGLCSLPCTAEQAVLDHDHSSGAVRATLHRACNAVLGIIENNYRRYGVGNLAAFTNGVAPYLTLHSFNITGLLHPSYKTPDDKRLARNAKARAARAAKKDS